MISSKVLPNLPISGNVRFDDQWDPIYENLIVNQVIRLPKMKPEEIDLEKEGGRTVDEHSGMNLLKLHQTAE